MTKQPSFKHPHDTLASSGFRFLTELIAWFAGPWAMSTISGWLAIPTMIVLIGLPAVFSTPGDKRHIVVATPGPIRALIELLLYLVAAITPWVVWPDLAAIACGGVAIVSVVLGLKRTRWLMMGAKDS
jgi:hypothetical protein